MLFTTTDQMTLCNMDRVIHGGAHIANYDSPPLHFSLLVNFSVVCKYTLKNDFLL